MFYVDVQLASTRVKLNQALTYSSEVALSVGQIVRVPLAGRTLNGVVVNAKTNKVKGIKPIKQVIEGAVLTKVQLDFAEELASFYAAPINDVLSMMVPAGIHKKRRSNATAQNFESLPIPKKLTADQKSAIAEIESTNQEQTILLHGATSSGKTLVYHKLVINAIKAKKGAILLVPEISLTTQFVQYFYSHFEEVFVLHSHLSEAERHLLWQGVHNAKTPVVIGPRSALFAPVKQLGLIVIDEFHDSSYKQDQSPKYLATRAARLLANHSKAKLILGSATPGVEDLFIAKNRTNPIISMRPVNEEKHDVFLNVVDITTKNNKSGVFSDKALDAIRTSLANKTQVLVFHNRRGTSTSVVCSSCGHIEECPNCSLPLTHHHDDATLRCHVCGHRSKLPHTCPECSQPDYLYKGYGTKELEQQLNKLFPTAKIARFDGDNKDEDRLENMYEKLRSGYIDIIVGTQVIAKGLDLPDLETVVIPNLDSLMFIPDYSTNERLYQLIYQVIGRIGRHRDGVVIAQTYNPTSDFVADAVHRDYDAFYAKELSWREESEYPPYSFLLSIIFKHKQRQRAQDETTKMVKKLASVNGIKVLGPAPAFHERLASGYRWQIVVKAKDRNKLISIIKALPNGWSYDIDPLSLL